MNLPASEAVGDQIPVHKLAFYNSGYSTCYKCGSQDLQVAANLTGISAVRQGEQVGFDVFTCDDCPWVTSFKWRSSCPQRYTEPIESKWQLTMHGYPIHWVRLWCEKHGLASLTNRLISNKVDGVKLMDWERRSRLQCELHLTDPEAEQLAEAMKRRDFTLK